MNSIIIFCSPNDSSAAELADLLLKSNCGIRITINPSGNLAAASIAAFCTVPSFLQVPKLLPETVAVCDSCDKNALALLAKSKTPAVIAGMSRFDTVTLSSITEKEATVSLLRPVASVYGNITEPCEFTVKLSKPYSCRTILLYSAVMILLNIFPEQM